MDLSSSDFSLMIGCSLTKSQAKTFTARVARPTGGGGAPSLTDPITNYPAGREAYPKTGDPSSMRQLPR